ncbi:MAE_28990/MAE_18760 family HEPN-like nuclease [uncultured Cohaesibacter sp.]|uniref:MAE_28990/MAE_18760 family HEPN-like nuclease n=1 Tax=uncultured Cohaesibacter sp. TaxID=1002546 RepID=UPI0029C79436|nr:MAE_28990/MAE_18760 family HEPN-like nuclease [uncultured Cohaesibacter sp.]
MDIGDFQRRLDEIRAWRKLELSNARMLAENHESGNEVSYLCRAWTMMIYAHCDQSLKLIAKEYLSFLKEHPRSDYDYNTVWLCFFGKEAIRHISDNRYGLVGSETVEAKDRFISNIGGREVFDSANFSYKLLRFFTDWILQVSFDCGNYKAFCKTLKEKRDAIAHGEEIRIQRVEDCISWHDPAISMIDSLADASIDAALRHDVTT